MKKYQLVPETVEATQLKVELLRSGGRGTGTPGLPAPLDLKIAPVMFHGLRLKYDALGYHLQIPPGEGGRRVDPGDWLIVRANGRREACTDAEFRAKFQEVHGGDYLDSENDRRGGNAGAGAGATRGNSGAYPDGKTAGAGPADHSRPEAGEARSGAGVGVLVAA